MNKLQFQAVEVMLRSHGTLESMLAFKTDQLHSELEYASYLDDLYSRMPGVDKSRIPYVRPPAHAKLSSAAQAIEQHVNHSARDMFAGYSDQSMVRYLDYLTYLDRTLSPQLKKGCDIEWLEDPVRPSPHHPPPSNPHKLHVGLGSEASTQAAAYVPDHVNMTPVSSGVAGVHVISREAECWNAPSHAKARIAR